MSEDLRSGRFHGKVVAITGAASGIGKETALGFANEGAEAIVLIDRSERNLRETATLVERAGSEAHSIVADLSSIHDCESVIPRVINLMDQIDVVIHNAAPPRQPQPFLTFELSSWNEDFDVICTAGFIITRDAAQFMADRNGGSILFTGSISAYGAGEGFVAYCAAKAAVEAMVKVMAAELAEKRVRVNGVHPGPADTQRSVELVGEEAMATYRESFPVVPLGRLASPEDIASSFLFLASDEASYITGQMLVVDGGVTARVYSAPQSSG